MKNELLISEIQAECNDFADKVMEIYNSKNIMIQFNVFDPEEMRKDAMKDNQKGEWMEKVIFKQEIDAVSFDKWNDKKIGFHETYFTIEEVEKILKKAKELENGK